MIWRRQNYGIGKKIRSCQREGVRQSAKNSRAAKLLCPVVMCSSQPQERSFSTVTSSMPHVCQPINQCSCLSYSNKSSRPKKEKSKSIFCVVLHHCPQVVVWKAAMLSAISHQVVVCMLLICLSLFGADILHSGGGIFS